MTLKMGLVQAKRVNMDVACAGHFCRHCKGVGGMVPNDVPYLAETFHSIRTINGLIVCGYCQGTGIIGGEP